MAADQLRSRSAAMERCVVFANECDDLLSSVEIEKWNSRGTRVAGDFELGSVV